jgi:hypothetical protein
VLAGLPKRVGGFFIFIFIFCVFNFSLFLQHTPGARRRPQGLGDLVLSFFICFTALFYFSLFL